MRPATTSRALARSLLTSQRRAKHSTSSAVSSTKPISSVLIANRGEIALRVGRTAANLGVRCTTIYTDPDALSQHALSSPNSVNLGAPSAYLDGERIISVAKTQGCEALHPGYGFLSENSAFAKRCVEEGIVFIGPPWEAIEAMGNKSRSKEIMIGAGVPCIPGYHGENQDPQHLLQEAEKIGFPVLVKAVRGGGGKGMRIVQSKEEFLTQLESAKSEGRNSFGDDVMLVEKYIKTPRHIEVQVFADKHGNAVALGERDCSLQRRHQKILEEAPAPNLPEDIRQDLWEKARAAALAVGYEGAGTVEFIFDKDSNQFYFMEMNTRLQVEHPVTEEVTGEDLVSWQFKVAAGERLPLTQDQIAQRIRERGWAIEARIYAENPSQGFMPDSGGLIHLRTPPLSDSVRIDAGFVEGDTISSAYDGMIAKLIVSGPTRAVAIQKMHAALEDYEVVGLSTNIEFLKRVCKSQDFVSGDVETGYIEKHHDELFAPETVEEEAYAQAALALLKSEQRLPTWLTSPGPHGESVGFQSYTERHFDFAAPTANSAPISVSVRQTSPTLYDITVVSSAAAAVSTTPTTYPNVTCSSSSGSASSSSFSSTPPTTITTFFPHTRITSTLVTSPSSDPAATATATANQLTLFQRGRRVPLTLVAPGWLDRARGVAAVRNSVRAPMPCKVLRIEVAEGEVVARDQALVVIESMKMETVIRSPQDGVVAKLVHKAGDICKAGTVLVLFEEGEEEGDGKETSKES